MARLKTYTFVVPGHPVPKARARGGIGHHYTPARTREYEQLVMVEALKARVRPIAGNLAMVIEFYLSRPDCADIDNLAKSILDALNGTAYKDDRQVITLVLHKMSCEKDDERAEVALTEL